MQLLQFRRASLSSLQTERPSDGSTGSFALHTARCKPAIYTFLRTSSWISSHACKGKHSIDTTLLLLLQGNSKKVWDAWLDRTSTSTSTGWMASNATPCSGLVEQIQMREVGAAQSRACVRPHHDWSLGDALTSRLPLPARPVDHHHIDHHLISSRTAYASCMSRLCMYPCNAMEYIVATGVFAWRPGLEARAAARQQLHPTSCSLSHVKRIATGILRVKFS